MGAPEWPLPILKTTLLLKQKKPTKKPLSPSLKNNQTKSSVFKMEVIKAMAIVLIFTAYKIINEEEDIYDDHIKYTFWLLFFNPLIYTNTS